VRRQWWGFHRQRYGLALRRHFLNLFVVPILGYGVAEDSLFMLRHYPSQPLGTTLSNPTIVITLSGLLYEAEMLLKKMREWYAPVVMQGCRQRKDTVSRNKEPISSDSNIEPVQRAKPPSVKVVKTTVLKIEWSFPLLQLKRVMNPSCEVFATLRKRQIPKGTAPRGLWPHIPNRSRGIVAHDGIGSGTGIRGAPLRAAGRGGLTATTARISCHGGNES